jgi:hypothetical protein
METLWLAIVFYSIGLGIVLHFKPAIMFNENGTWKEFGYQRAPGKTLFPFWLFAISWAFLSYTFATTVRLIAPAIPALAALAPNMSYLQNEEEDNEEEEEEEYIEPVSEVRKRGRPRKTEVREPLRESQRESQREPQRESLREPQREPQREEPRPGYYVVDPKTTEKGLRKYIYYGPESPPSDEEN